VVAAVLVAVLVLAVLAVLVAFARVVVRAVVDLCLAAGAPGRATSADAGLASRVVSRRVT
jgi:hypothetical protein